MEKRLLVALVDHKLSTLSTGLSTIPTGKSIGNTGLFSGVQKNSTADSTGCGEIFGLQNIGTVKHLGGEDPVAGAGLLFPGFHLQQILVIDLPVQVQQVSFPGFCMVADGEFPDLLLMMEATGQQVSYPL